MNLWSRVCTSVSALFTDTVSFVLIHLQSRLEDAESLIRKLSDELAAANNSMSPTPVPPPKITANSVTPEATSGDDDAFGCFEGAFPASSDLDDDQVGLPFQ